MKPSKDSRVPRTGIGRTAQGRPSHLINSVLAVPNVPIQRLPFYSTDTCYSLGSAGTTKCLVMFYLVQTLTIVRVSLFGKRGAASPEFLKDETKVSRRLAQGTGK